MGKYKSIWTGPQVDEGVGVALNPDTVPTAGSDALVTSDAVATVQAGLAPFENGATSSDDYAVGDLLVRAGILYKAKTAIAVGDAFTVDTNIEVATIAEVLENFNPGPDPYTSDPAMDGTASPGSSGNFARGDHIHPHDTSIQQISAPTLTSPASENIAAGKYRVYNNLLYKVTTAITSGETASSFASKLEAVPDGGLNDLKSAIESSYKGNAVFCAGIWSKVGWEKYMMVIPMKDANKYSIAQNGTFYTFVGSSNVSTAITISRQDPIGFVLQTSQSGVEGYYGQGNFTIT